MMGFWLPCLLSGLVLAALVHADQATLPAAGQAMALDNAGASARALAMGSAFVAVPGDEASLAWNPAGLAKVPEATLGLHHNSWLMDAYQETLAVAFPLGAENGLGMQLNFVDFGTFQSRDVQGNLGADFSAYRMGFGGGWGGRLPRLARAYAGLEARGSVEAVESAAYSSLAFDVGALWQPLDWLDVGAAWRDLGSPLASFFPANGLQTGLSLKPRPWLLFACATQWEPTGVNRLQLGLETIWGGLAGRAGYQLAFQDNHWNGLNSVSLGGGFKMGDLNLDYAWLPFGDLGSSQRLSLRYHFMDTPRAAPSSSPDGSEKAGFTPDKPGKSLDLDFNFGKTPRP
jgi:hypothetical protein